MLFLLLPLLDPSRAPITSNVGVRSNREDHTHPSLASGERFVSVAPYMPRMSLEGQVACQTTNSTTYCVLKKKCVTIEQPICCCSCSLMSLVHPVSILRDSIRCFCWHSRTDATITCFCPLHVCHMECPGISTVRAFQGHAGCLETL